MLFGTSRKRKRMSYQLELDVLGDMIPVEFHGDLPIYREAIEAVRAGDEDRLLTWPDEEQPFARAYQVVAIFDLTAFTIERST
jgi:hypothetical protein